MLPNDRVQSTGREKLSLVDRVQRAMDRIPMPQRIVPIAGAVLFLCPVLAPVAAAALGFLHQLADAAEQC